MSYVCHPDFRHSVLVFFSSSTVTNKGTKGMCLQKNQNKTHSRTPHPILSVVTAKPPSPGANLTNPLTKSLNTIVIFPSLFPMPSPALMKSLLQDPKNPYPPVLLVFYVSYIFPQSLTAEASNPNDPLDVIRIFSNPPFLPFCLPLLMKHPVCCAEYI